MRRICTGGVGLCVLLGSACEINAPAAALLPHSAAARTGPVLAKDGVARMSIVVSATAAPATRQVANELATYLSRASNAHFEVITGDGKQGVVVGTSEEFPLDADAPALAIHDRFDGREAFVVRTEPQRIRLIGASVLGVPHAVFAFLEALGFRWYFPGKEWEVVPSLRTLRADVNLADRPRLLSRMFSIGFGFFDGTAKGDFEAWERHNRLGESLTVRQNHAWQAVIAKNKAEFAQHPEYFALSGGKRDQTKLCVSNPEVQRIALQYVLDMFAKSPELDMVSLEASDGLGHCECDKCRALGPPGGQPFYLANVVARQLQKILPGKFIGLLAYGEHAAPPTFPLEPNVFVQLTNGFDYSPYTVPELADQWHQRLPYTGYYEYFSVHFGDLDLLPSLNGANVEYLTKQIAFIVAHGAMSLNAEASDNFGPNGRGYYLATRLMWNPQADVHAVLEDFYRNAFHAAAPAMRRFYERFDPGNAPLMGRELLGQGYRDIAEAERLASGDATVQLRLDRIEQYLHYVKTRREFEASKDPVVRKRLALDILTEGYRTRRSYMNHWRAIWFLLTVQAATEFNEPSWSRLSPGAHPWQVEGEPGHDETRQRFHAELESLPVHPVRETQFARRLARVTLTPGQGATGTSAPFNLWGGGTWGGRFVLDSNHGEPVDFTIRAGLISAFRQKPDARWTLRDDAEHVVATGRVPLDNSDHAIEQTVPAAGLYFLDMEDSGAGWNFAVPSGRVGTFVLPPGRGARSLSQVLHFYFYVPKGTRKVEYFWSGRAHDVRGPDGTILQKVDATDTRVSVSVPAGADGKIWSLEHPVMSTLHFYTVPNYVATSSDGLVVPEDVAKADKLVAPLP